MNAARASASLALLDAASPQQIRDAVVTYRAISLAALDSLAEAYTRIATLERQLAESRYELRRITSAAFPHVVPEAQP